MNHQCCDHENLRTENGCACCSQRSKQRTDEEKKKLINRLNRIEGQIRGLRSMIENEGYCTDILMQTNAAGAALNAFSREVLATHIRTCVANDIRNGKDEVIDDLIDTLRQMMK